MSALGRHGDNTAVSRWADRHGLISELLPLAGRDTDSIELAREAAAAIDDLPRTASSFTVDEVLPEARGYTTTIFRALGSWPLPGEFAQRRWVNPNYLHTHALGDVTEYREADRLEIVEECAALGVLKRDDVAARLGLQDGSFGRWVTRQSVPWCEWRREGIERFARTLYTAADWADYSQRELCEVWPVPSGTVRSWIQHYAREDAFEPPADPTVTGELEVGQ